MKKNIFILFIVVILAISFVWIFEYVSHEGEFTKWSHTTLGKNHFIEGKTFYLDYLIRWEGIGNPTLEKIEFIKEDGTIVAKEDDQLRIEPFINLGGYGQVDEEFAIKEGIIEELIPVKGFKVIDDFYLVLRVELTDSNFDKDISEVRMTYKKFGRTQFQYISFEDGLITEE
ncbi:hypothetical protein [Alkalihalobacterium alkalinitrilicum]|uniref:hypothetical protein n=1 Tax=Alkalihalobacterium alkalinitrilicum TaxID=427920 RepID=UPI0009959F53|nr:hypothetical protein [Alkalihalobacterium alkalinitrilicum]